MAMQMLGAFSPAQARNPMGQSPMAGHAFNLGLALGQLVGDTFAGSGGGGECPTCGGGEDPLGGLGGGFGNPMLGMGQLGQMPPEMSQLLGSLLGMLMESMGEQGCQGPSCGSCGDPGMGGMDGGCGGGFPGMDGMAGPCPMGGPGGGAPGGEAIELTQGQSFTTPGGATINWQGDEVKVSEPGGAEQSQRTFGGGNSTNMSAAMAGPGFSAALSMSFGGGAAGPMGAAGQHAAQDGKPRDWRVWGDPHIDHPNGEKSDFKTKNAMFTLQDGTQVMMGADNPKGVVQKIQVILPGGQPNWGAGYDPKDTSIMRDNGKGKFEEVGTADQMMQGGFGMPGFGLAGMGGGFPPFQV